MIASDGSVRSVDDVAAGLAKTIPHRLAPPVFANRSLDLVGGGGCAPNEIVAEVQRRSLLYEAGFRRPTIGLNRKKEGAGGKSLARPTSSCWNPKWRRPSDVAMLPSSLILFNSTNELYRMRRPWQGKS